MAILKSLNFTAVPKKQHSPVAQRRAKLVKMLKEQRALFTDPAFSRVVQRWKLDNGQKVKVDHQIKVKPWWFEDDKGQVVLTLRFGLKTLEFEKGKTGILVGSKGSSLVKTIRDLDRSNGCPESSIPFWNQSRMSNSRERRSLDQSSRITLDDVHCHSCLSILDSALPGMFLSTVRPISQTVLRHFRTMPPSHSQVWNTP